jgi:UDP-GlcNAc:undecaprenyl-phosphate GlcNAc-1-phosphate transferase
MSGRLLIVGGVLTAAYLLASVLIFPVRVLALRLGVLDVPGGRKSHDIPVPRLGGLAIFGSLALVVWGSLFWLPYLNYGWIPLPVHDSLKAISNYTVVNHKLYALFTGATIVTLIGLLDDFYGARFSPYLKLAGQAFAAFILIFAGIRMDAFQALPWFSALMTTLWIVGITNSFNLLDNMDGLSSGIALICASIFLILVLQKGEFFNALLISALIGSTLGFFQFNMRGRFIFMGDAGSLLLGYFLGAISLFAHYVDQTDESLFPLLAPLIILGLPLFDTFSVIIIRLREGRSVFQGDQMHLSHRLVQIGMSTRQAVLFNYLMAAAIAMNALLILDSSMLRSVVALLQVAALVAMVSILMVTKAAANHK